MAKVGVGVGSNGCAVGVGNNPVNARVGVTGAAGEAAAGVAVITCGSTCRLWCVGVGNTSVVGDSGDGVTSGEAGSGAARLSG